MNNGTPFCEANPKQPLMTSNAPGISPFCCYRDGRWTETDAASQRFEETPRVTHLMDERSSSEMICGIFFL